MGHLFSIFAKTAGHLVDMLHINFWEIVDQEILTGAADDR